MDTSIPKAYDFKKVEGEIYDHWERSGYFNPDNVPSTESQTREKSFTISMPPPNATGTLHTGHALFLTIQDAMIRYKRLRGYRTLWLPGTDHAAIATQAKVEKILWDEEKKTRHDLGRKKFLQRVEAFIEQSRNTIRKQIRLMGSSCDWSREKYTLDSDLSRAVRQQFSNMYRDGLIYRGYRIVNWCTRCQSTLSDDEVLYKPKIAKFYYLRYGPVVIGTARPETKFGDKFIIVHPRDTRYSDLIDQEFDVEWINGKIRARVIADESADMDMGTGAMTITPAHSFIDFDLAQKYSLPIVPIIDEQGRLTQAVGDMAGLHVTEGRKKVIERLQAKGLVVKINDHYKHNLSVCYRCETPVEPLPSKQWFVAVNKTFILRHSQSKSIQAGDPVTLKKLMQDVVGKKQITIIPRRFEKTYFHWIDHLRDWCISRQIWFGHRIPVWYCQKNPESCPPIVATETPSSCPWCQSKELRQDPDTLDTWFSSGLWTFSTLGWPKNMNAKGEKTRDLATFHPTQMLETGYDILFFWVARMILMTTYALGEVPFQEVYLHGLVRDEKGRKMSKSLGNVVDPLIVINQFGTDALRLTYLIGTTPGNDMRLSEKKIAGNRNLINKLWNIVRYIILSNAKKSDPPLERESFTLSDRWVVSRYADTVQRATKALDRWNFSRAGENIRTFMWNELADWYLEVSKSEKNTEKGSILAVITEGLLQMWHPFIPFVTENVWKLWGAKSPLMVSSWPQISPKYRDKEAERMFQAVQEIVTAVRDIRSRYRVQPKKMIKAWYGQTRLIEEQLVLIQKLARIELLKGASEGKTTVMSHPALTLHIPLGEFVDLKKEWNNLRLNLDELETVVERQKKKLENRTFLKKAPKAVVQKEREKLEQWKAKLAKIREELHSYE